MKRVISIILSIALVLMAVAVPALAADESLTTGPEAYNFLESTGYYNYAIDDTPAGYFTSSHRSFSYASLDNSIPVDGFRWRPIVGEASPFAEDVVPTRKGETMSVDYLTYVVLTDRELGDVVFEYIDTYGEENSVDGSFGDPIIMTDEGLYLYNISFHVNDTIYTAFCFDVVFGDQNYQFYFESLALYRDSFYKRVSPVASLDAYGQVFNRLDGVYYRERFITDGSGIGQYTVNNNNQATFPADDRLSVYIEYDERYFVGADKFTFSMSTTGVWDNWYEYGSVGEVGLTVYTRDQDSYNIPVSAYVTKSENMSRHGDPVFLITFSADLSPYNLRDCMVIFNFIVNARQPYDNDFKEFYFYINDTYFYFGEHENYDPEDRYFERLSQWFAIEVVPWFWNWFGSVQEEIFSMNEDVTNALGRFGTGIWDAIEDFDERVEAAFNLLDSNLSDYFGDLFDKLEEYFAVPEDTAPPDSSDQQQGIEDSIGEMDDIADQFGTAGDQIDQLLPETPNYNDIGLAGNRDLAATNISYILMVFNPLWENDFIITVLTFSCMLALGGFILFGER